MAGLGSKTTREVECYVGRSGNSDGSGQWYVTTIEIPSDTPEDEVAKTAITLVEDALSDRMEPVAFVGVYSIPQLEDE